MLAWGWGGAEGVGVPVEPPVGAEADRPVSHASSGKTYERSRSSRSKAIRVESAAVGLKAGQALCAKFCVDEGVGLAAGSNAIAVVVRLRFARCSAAALDAEHEHGSEDREHGDPAAGEEQRQPRDPTALASILAREEVDGSHRSVLDPQPNGDGHRSDLIFVDGFGADPHPRTDTDLTGTPASRPTASGRPSMCAVPPASAISPIPRAPGWAW